MMIAVARRFRRDGVVPPRDLVFAFVADEEAGGALGAQWLVEQPAGPVRGLHRGGRRGRRLLADGQRAAALPDRGGREGPGLDAAAGARRARARVVPARRQRRHQGRRGRRAAGQPPVPAGRARHRARSSWTGSARSPGWRCPRDDVEGGMRKLGPLARIVGATVRDTVNPTMLKAGYKANVIPSTAEAVVDCRVLPGREEAFLREVDELLGPGRHPRVGHAPAGGGDAVRGGAGRRDGRRAGGARPGRAHRAVHALGRHRRQVVRTAGHALLRLRAAAAAAGPGLRVAVPRHRRAGAGGRADSSARGCSTSSCGTAERRATSQSACFLAEAIALREPDLCEDLDREFGQHSRAAPRRSTTLRTPPG